MTEVIKSDKSVQPFQPEKIRKSIEAAARESELPEKRVKEVVEKVSKPAIAMAQKAKRIETRAIRERILKELDKAEPSVSEAWRRHDRSKSKWQE